MSELLHDKREAETKTSLGESLRRSEVDHGVRLEGDGRRRRSGHGSKPGVEKPGEGGLRLVGDESAAEEERLPVVVEACEGGERDLSVASHVGSVEDEGVAEVSVVRPASRIGPEDVSTIFFLLQCVGEGWVLEVLAFQIVQDVLQTHRRSERELRRDDDGTCKTITLEPVLCRRRSNPEREMMLQSNGNGNYLGLLTCWAQPIEQVYR